MGTFMPPPARSEMPAVTIGDSIYVPGGFGGPVRLDRYNPERDQWQTLAQMPAGRHHLMATAYEGRLYLFGGAPPQSRRYMHAAAIMTMKMVDSMSPGMMPAR